MYWYVWWGASAFVFLAALVDAFVLSKLRYKRKRILTSNKVLILGTSLSAMLLLFPICLEKFSDSVWWVEWGKSILISMQHAIRLFAFGGGFMDFFETEAVFNLPPIVQMLYTGSSMVLYAFAPLLTFGLILSFFKNVSAYRKYLFSFYKHTHVFSELNERSLALAKSIDQIHNKTGEGKRRRYRIRRRALIVFTDVLDKTGEKNLDLLEEAKELGAILFSKDLESIRYRRKHSVRRLSFYLISDDEKEKIRHAESIMRDYDFDETVELRVFSDDIRSELLLAAKSVKSMKVIRVNDVQSLVYHNLDVHGLRLFQNARSVTDADKVISAVIVGLGKYGIEMMKALTWFCQMDGYRVKINAFDIDKRAEENFKNMCPELMSGDYNGKNIPGEARYEIHIHGGIDARGAVFAEKLEKISDATYIFVCLGKDEENLATAVRIRSLCEGVQYTGDGHKPDIETVIHDSNVSASMGMKWAGDKATQYRTGVSNFKKQPYNIHMIGDLEQLYSVETMLDSEMVRIAEEANKNYAEYVYSNGLEKISSLAAPQYAAEKAKLEQERKENIRAFYKYEYNYRSSIARMIHEKKSAELSLKNPELEHKRWNAYMRTEGYRYSGSDDEASRNDLARLHHNLVPFANLDNKRDVPKDN